MFHAGSLQAVRGNFGAGLVVLTSPGLAREVWASAGALSKSGQTTTSLAAPVAAPYATLPASQLECNLSGFCCPAGGDPETGVASPVGRQIRMSRWCWILVMAPAVFVQVRFRRVSGAKIRRDTKDSHPSNCTSKQHTTGRSPVSGVATTHRSCPHFSLSAESVEVSAVGAAHSVSETADWAPHLPPPNQHRTIGGLELWRSRTHHLFPDRLGCMGDPGQPRNDQQKDEKLVALPMAGRP